MREDHLRHKQRGRRQRVQLTLLLAFCASLIVVATLEVLMFIGPVAFQNWKHVHPEATVGEYSALLLIRYFLSIMIPVSLGLYTYFTLRGAGMPVTYRFVWGGIVLIAIIRKALAFETSSPWWYITLVLQVGLLLVVINLHRIGRDEQEKEGVYGS